MFQDEADVVQPDIAYMIELQRTPFPPDSPLEHAVTAPLACLVDTILTERNQQCVHVEVQQLFP